MCQPGGPAEHHPRRPAGDCASQATAAGRHFVGAGVNTIQERVSTLAFVNALETTANTAFTNLTTVGPAVTVTVSANCWVRWPAD